MRTFQRYLIVVLAALAIGVSARADTTVWLNFAPLPAEPPQAQRNAVLAGLVAKFAFEPNIHFTLTVPAAGTPNVFVISFNNGTAEEYGDSTAHGTTGVVYIGNLMPGADGHLESGFFDTVEKRQNAMKDIAAHELGHLFGCKHNCVAPTTSDTEEDPTGHGVFRRKPVGKGADANGRTGLMADGHKVLPSEVAADQRDFTAGEKDDIIAFINNLKGVTTTKSDPRKGNTKSSKSVKTVKGQRPIIVPMPPFPTESPSVRACPWVDVNIQFVGPGWAGWEFGYIDVQGGFRRFVRAGMPDDVLSLPPAKTYDFAIHQQGAPASARVSTTEGVFLPQPSQPVNPAESVEPVVTQPYFRSLTLFFDHDNSPVTQPFMAILTLGEPDLSDGLLPVPGCAPDFNNINGLNIQDIFDFLTAWFAGSPLADFDEMNGIQIADVFSFLNAWFAGCP